MTTIGSVSLTEEEQQQAIAFDKTTSKGAEGGLFQACMKSIRMAHASANRLRAGLVLAGLFTDKEVYREVIVLFYAATKELEDKLLKLKDSDEICQKLLSLGYQFSSNYEKDLQSLYSKDSWKKEVEKVFGNSSKEAKDYIHNIKTMKSGADLAGAAFCLWGALIIGGGAVAMPRVEALCGKDAIHIFKDVTGPGRAERTTKFVELWDSLATLEDVRF